MMVGSMDFCFLQIYTIFISCCICVKQPVNVTFQCFGIFLPKKFVHDSLHNLLMKRIFTTLCIALLLFTAPLAAQNTAYFKVADQGSFLDVQPVTGGGYITLGLDENWDMRVIKLDANWQPLWQVTFNDVNISPVRPGLAVANDGNYYVMAGSSQSGGSTFIAKLSPSGTILWQKLYYLASGSLVSEAISKASGSDNGFIFGGGQCTLTNFLIKCDENGAIVWQYQYIYPLSTGVTVVWSIIPEGSNYVVSSGYNINSLLSYRLDASGTVLAHSAYTYSGMQIVPDKIVKLPVSGGYAVLGNYNNSNNNKTQFIAFYNQAFTLQSFNELTVTYTQFTLNGITAVSNGKNVVAVGNIYDNSEFTLVMLKMSAQGNLQWYKRATGNAGSNYNVELDGVTTAGSMILGAGFGSDEGSVLALIDSNGNGFCNTQSFSLSNIHPSLSLQSSVIAPAASSALVQNVTYTSSSNLSANQYVYCGSLSGIENMIREDEFSLAPNPVGEQLLLKIPDDFDRNNASVKVYNTAGMLVVTRSISDDKSEVRIDVSSLQPGLYFVSISGEQVLNARLIKE
jgi:hypothetical protein